MIDHYRANKYCRDDISLIENYQFAIADKTQTWHCHHRREIDEHKSIKQLIEEDKYYCVPASDLIFLTEFDHKHIHNSGNNHYLFGKHQSKTTRDKISKKKCGKHLSDAHKRAISDSNIGREVTNDTRSKISKANTGKLHPTEWTKVYQYTLDGQFIAEYASFGAASLATGIRYQNISACCRHVTKSSGGFIWKYA